MEIAFTPVATPSGGAFASPLRYPGGKGRLGPWIAELLRHNRISGGWYVEPYAGGAGAAIYLLTQGYVDHIVINDLDPAVYAFWWAVLNDTEHFLSLLAETPVTMDHWYRQKEVHADPDSFSQTEIGFATFFLNRTNRSGILKGGVIGGKNQDGPYLLDARFNKANLAERIKSVSSLADHITLSNEDALALLADIEGDLPSRSLIYLDPPYFQKGSQLYRNHYRPEDHKQIANYVQELKTPWIVTYDNCPEIHELYSDCHEVQFSLYYSTAAGRPLATEVMFYGNLEIPSQPSLTRRSI
ncbi:MAG: DNA adenine methylase [Dechloromonas sp.]|nr:DNA adenine methylase [Dechloromonas sp.]